LFVFCSTWRTKASSSAARRWRLNWKRESSVADPKAFRSGRDFSAWIRLVPKESSSGGKDRLGSISKRGDRYLRSLFTAGALAVIRYAKIHGTKALAHRVKPPAKPRYKIQRDQCAVSCSDELTRL
jgi:transposase